MGTGISTLDTRQQAQARSPRIRLKHQGILCSSRNNRRRKYTLSQLLERSIGRNRSARKVLPYSLAQGHRSGTTHRAGTNQAIERSTRRACHRLPIPGPRRRNLRCRCWCPSLQSEIGALTHLSPFGRGILGSLRQSQSVPSRRLLLEQAQINCRAG